MCNAFHHGVGLRSVHHTTESVNYQVYSIFWSEVLKLFFLFDALIYYSRYYNENNVVSHKLCRESFYFRHFFIKHEAWKQTISKLSDSQVWCIPQSQTLWVAWCIPPWSQASRCASLCGVMWPKFLKKLCCVHHTAESAICIILRSQGPRCDAHLKVRIENFAGLCLLLKGKSGDPF